MPELDLIGRKISANDMNPDLRGILGPIDWQEEDANQYGLAMGGSYHPVPQKSVSGEAHWGETGAIEYDLNC